MRQRTVSKASKSNNHPSASAPTDQQPHNAASAPASRPPVLSFGFEPLPPRSRKAPPVVAEANPDPSTEVLRRAVAANVDAKSPAKLAAIINSLITATAALEAGEWKDATSDLDDPNTIATACNALRDVLDSLAPVLVRTGLHGALDQPIVRRVDIMPTAAGSSPDADPLANIEAKIRRGLVINGAMLDIAQDLEEMTETEGIDIGDVHACLRGLNQATITATERLSAGLDSVVKARCWKESDRLAVA